MDIKVNQLNKPAPVEHYSSFKFTFTLLLSHNI